MKIVYWGTYDLGKPRNRILLRGLRENNVHIVECHKDLWHRVEDKSQISGLLTKFLFLCSWLFAYPRLIYRYLKIPEHDAVVVGYLGLLDVLVLWSFAKLRGVPIVWDAFMSLYDTVVCDRGLLHRYHPLAFLIYTWEWLACRAADLIVLDTHAHAGLFRNLYGVAGEKLQVTLVGVEPEVFAEGKKKDLVGEFLNQNFTVLFYGQFIPLHGIDTIIEAARLLQAYSVSFIIIGKGQEEKRIQEILAEHPLQNLKWIPWVEYPDLVNWIQRADICLGIFGDSAKASRVIPNKVFQIVTAGKPIITIDSPAIRELLSPEMDAVTLVRANDPVDLAAQIHRMAQMNEGRKTVYPETVRNKILPKSIGNQMRQIINEVVKRNKR